jgi:hypothetical protein
MVMFAKLEKALKSISDNDSTLFVGWDKPEMVRRARFTEYGGHTAEGYYVPPRPHRKQTLDKYSDEWKKDLAKALKLTKYDINKSLEILAMKAKANYQDMIMSGEYHALSPITLAIRKAQGIYSNQPLIATGDMFRTLRWKLKNE